ncbi:hypothetical protein E1508_18880 [Pseudomonas moraviensis]|nr:hypothetical protein E1508_18880 [Pseudomonas moraviensis]
MGASLLAKAVGQSTFIVNVEWLSRAGSLPRGIVVMQRILRSSLNSNVTQRCNTAAGANSRTVVLPPFIVYNRAVFYAILASDLLCRITVTVYSPQFSRLECP